MFPEPIMSPADLKQKFAPRDREKDRRDETLFIQQSEYSRQINQIRALVVAGLDAAGRSKQNSASVIIPEWNRASDVVVKELREKGYTVKYEQLTEHLDIYRTTIEITWD